jgi:hypothetical protein
MLIGVLMMSPGLDEDPALAGEGTGEVEHELDPLGLGLDLSDVDTSRPILPEGIMVLEIGKVGREASKKVAGNFNLVVEFKTTSDSPDVTGEKVLPAGWKLTKYYPLQQSSNDKAPDYKADLARLQDAVEGTEQGNRPPFSPFNYTGRLVMGKIKISTTDEYGTQNEIAKLEKVTE